MKEGDNKKHRTGESCRLSLAYAGPGVCLSRTAFSFAGSDQHNSQSSSFLPPFFVHVLLLVSGAAAMLSMLFFTRAPNAHFSGKKAEQIVYICVALVFIFRANNGTPYDEHHLD